MTHLLFDLLFEIVLYQLKQIKGALMKFTYFHFKEKTMKTKEKEELWKRNKVVRETEPTPTQGK